MSKTKDDLMSKESITYLNQKLKFFEQVLKRLNTEFSSGFSSEKIYALEKLENKILDKLDGNTKIKFKNLQLSANYAELVKGEEDELPF